MKTMTSKIKLAWNWLVVSSANPEKLALTVRGFLVGIIPLALYLAPLAGIQLDAGNLSGIVELIKQLVEVGLGLIAGIITLYGLIRKIVLSVKGS